MERRFCMKFTKRLTLFFMAATMLAVLPFSVRASAEISVGLFDSGKKDNKKEDKGEETGEPYDKITPKRGDLSPDKKRKKGEGEHCGAAKCQTNTDGANGWYCAHTEGGKRPSVPAEMSFIDKNGGYFLGEDERVIYLTFDAGYENGNIAKILDTLKAEEVPAAFFVLENLVKRDTELVRRMLDEGHTVCNHTARHPDMTKKTEVEFTAEISEMEKVYKETMGEEISKYYRPPEGRFTEENLKWANLLGYKTIFWSYAYADWDNDRQPSADKAYEKVISGTHNGEVILLHPTSATNAEILPRLIREWKRMGYRFGTLDELTGESGEV